MFKKKEVKKMTDARKCYNFKSSVLVPQGIECYRLPDTNSYLVTRAPKDTTHYLTYLLKVEPCDITLADIHFTAICLLLGDTLEGIDQQLSLCKRGVISHRHANHTHYEMPVYRANLIKWLRNRGINYTIGTARARGTLPGVIYELGYDSKSVHNIDTGQLYANETLETLAKSIKERIVSVSEQGDRIGTWYTLVVDKTHWHQRVDHPPKGPYIETDKDYVLWCLSNAHSESPYEMPVSEFMEHLRRFDKMWLDGGLYVPRCLAEMSQFIKLVHKMFKDKLESTQIRNILRTDSTLLANTNSQYEHIDDKYSAMAMNVDRLANNGAYMPVDRNQKGIWVLCPEDKYKEVEEYIRLGHL